RAFLHVEAEPCPPRRSSTWRGKPCAFGSFSSRSRCHPVKRLAANNVPFRAQTGRGASVTATAESAPIQTLPHLTGRQSGMRHSLLGVSDRKFSADGFRVRA